MFCVEADSVQQKTDVSEERLIISVAENSDAAPFKGLCFNCDNRDNCMLPKPEEGVWHCEEYI